MRQRTAISALLILALLPVSFFVPVCDPSCQKAGTPATLANSQTLAQTAHHHHSSPATARLFPQGKIAAQPHQISDSHGCCGGIPLTVLGPCSTSPQNESQARTSSQQFDGRSVAAQVPAECPAIKEANRFLGLETLLSHASSRSLTLRI